MILVSILIFSLVIEDAAPYECCKDHFCSPPQLRMKPLYIDNEISLPEASSGCLCKEYPRKYLKCFGRTTCHKIPRDLILTVPELKLTTTNIKMIAKEDLSSYISLTKLDIENHIELEFIEEYSFFNLSKLTNMSISSNPNLRFLKPKTFIGLTRLRELHLLKNGFNSIIDFSESLSPKYLPNLYDLVLKENNFVHIKDTDFKPMQNSSVIKLNLAESRVNFIDPGSFSVFAKLEVLRLGVNPIDMGNLTSLILRLTRDDIPLKFLNLYRIGLKASSAESLLDAIGDSSIECLSLAGNQFEILTNETFPVMKSIKLLDLRDISAVDVTRDAFHNLGNLQSLLLGNNKFSSIPQGVSMENLTYLDMSSFPKFFNYISYFTVYNFTFSNMTKLTLLNLSFNTIQTIYRATFIGLSNLTILSLQNCDIFLIEQESFKPLKNLVFLDLESNHFAISKYKPLETDLFEGLVKLKVLLLGGNKISHITDATFSSLKSLTHLSLNNNKLLTLDPSHIIAMINLESIDLQENLLSSWGTNLFEDHRNLSTVYLGSNRITNLSVAMLNDFMNLATLDLSHNNFICNCKIYYVYTEWLAESGANFSEAFQRSNAICFPTERPVVDYLMRTEMKRSCEYDITEVAVFVSFFILALAMLLFWVYYYRWHLRYYFFLAKLHLIRKGKRNIAKEKAAHGNYAYDAFVSYSNEDSNFVTRVVSMLENFEPHLKLCVYERDFKVGSIISESILENVMKSRRVLLVISDNYVKSQWCQWETHIAQHCNLFFKGQNSDYIDDSLILIRLGPVSRKNLTPTLKYLLKTRIYLLWDEDETKQQAFWKKLRENLARGRTESTASNMTHL